MGACAGGRRGGVLAVGVADSGDTPVRGGVGVEYCGARADGVREDFRAGISEYVAKDLASRVMRGQSSSRSSGGNKPLGCDRW